MKQCIILTGEPKSTSHIYHSVCRGKFPSVYMTKVGKDIKEAYQWEAKAQWKGEPLEGDVSIAVNLYFGTRRKADWDNFHKLSMDALTGIAWVDDAQVRAAFVVKHYDPERPRIEIDIQ